MSNYEYADFDSYDQSVAGDEIWRRYADLRGKCPVGRSEEYGGYFLVTGDAECKEAAGKAAIFSSAEGVLFPPEPHMKFAPIEHDRPDHTWWRSIMSPPVTLDAVKKLEAHIDAAVHSCVDEFIERGSADLVQELAARVPQGMVGDIFGFEGESHRRAVELVAMFFETKGDERILQWVAAMNDFVAEETAARRANPRDDYLTHLITREHEGRMLTQDELLSLVTSFIIAGFHSTVAGMGTLLYYISADPTLRDRLIAEPAMIHGAVEEAIRMTPPLQIFRRVATQDTELGGMHIPAKSDVLLCYGAAVRDEQTVPEPDTFDPTRKINRHVGWGWGIHRCLGIALARAELRIAAEVVLNRMPDLRVDEGVAYGPLEGGMVMALNHLPVTFTPGAKSGESHQE